MRDAVEQSTWGLPRDRLLTPGSQHVGDAPYLLQVIPFVFQRLIEVLGQEVSCGEGETLPQGSGSVIW